MQGKKNISVHSALKKNAGTDCIDNTSFQKRTDPFTLSSNTGQVNIKKLTEISGSIKIANNIPRNITKAEENYKVISKIGKGSFGSVYKVKHNKTGLIRAMKVIKKENINYQDDERVFLKEIEILRKLEHPNIIKIIEYFTDNVNYYLITEYVDGGELYDTIIKCNKFNESKAAYIMKQILMALNYLHSFDIAHRDIKPENMLVEKSTTTDEKINIKLIDFGTCNYVSDDKKLTLKVGSPYYIAPEVLNKSYNKKCDIWSAGVILYIMLMGYPPFKGKNTNDLFNTIKKGVYATGTIEWNAISEDGQDLIKKMLLLDMEERPTAQECLNHPWIQSLASDSSDKLLPSVLSNIVHLNAREKLQQATIAYIVHTLYSSKEVEELKKAFQAMDLNNDGKLTYDEIKCAFEKCFGKQVSEMRINHIINAMDNNSDGVISYEEFLRVSINQGVLLDEKNLQTAFNSFDTNGDGKLSKDELKNVLNTTDFSYIDALLELIDNNKDGFVSFEEFKNLMRSIGGNAKKEKEDNEINVEELKRFIANRKSSSDISFSDAE